MKDRSYETLTVGKLRRLLEPFNDDADIRLAPFNNGEPNTSWAVPVLGVLHHNTCVYLDHHHHTEELRPGHLPIAPDPSRPITVLKHRVDE